jgi:hypothetical protein
MLQTTLDGRTHHRLAPKLSPPLHSLGKISSRLTWPALSCSSGQVWSWDLVAEQTENGSSFRILTLLD